MQKPKKSIPKKSKPKTPETSKALTDNDRMVSGWRVRLRSEMERQKFSLRGLSYKAGLGNSTVRYLLTDAEDVSLDALRKLSNALGVNVTWLVAGAHGFYLSDGPAGQGVRLLPIFAADDIDKKEPSAAHGSVPVMSAAVPLDCKAFVVQNAAMQIEGVNAPVSQHHVVLPGDVCLWSASAPQLIGELVVARTPRGGVVRRLTENDAGELRLVANNSAFPQMSVKKADVLGAVVAIWRAAR